MNRHSLKRSCKNIIKSERRSIISPASAFLLSHQNIEANFSRSFGGHSMDLRLKIKGSSTRCGTLQLVPTNPFQLQAGRELR